MLVEYEGTGYSGFQRQKGLPTVQSELEEAVWKVTGQRVKVSGAGRTDAGVHAKGQVASFECESRLSAVDMVRALSARLPADIAVRDACEVDRRFHPRRDALSREYRYSILNTPSRSALWARWAYWVPAPLDTDAMNRACGALIGEKDMAPFTNREGGKKNTVRRITKAVVGKRDGMVMFDIESNAFLPQQVRRVVAALVRVGLGKMTVQEFWELAACGEVGKARLVAPAHGLCLVRVNYSKIGFGL